MAPQGQFTPAGVVPRLKQFTIVGLFQVGMYEYDAGLALIHMDDAAKLYRMGDSVSGVRLKLDDLFGAPSISASIATQLNGSASSKGQYYVSDWTQQHANFFKAVQMEKRVMFIILTLIVAVAAFNIVSTLVMAVTDKRADIAIMRTLGASPASVMFIGTIIPFIEGLFHVQFLSKEVYAISDLPSDLIWSDVMVIVTMSFVLSLLATLYPSWRASKINPAEALRYE
jgi:lipoprotein-releasing system permease protein